MSYSKNVKNKRLKRTLQGIEGNLDIESDDILANDVALIELRISELLKEIDTVVTHKELKHLSSKIRIFESACEEFREQCLEKKVELPQSYYSILQLIGNLLADLKKAINSESAWKQINALQASKLRLVESQRNHNVKRDSRVTKKDMAKAGRKFLKVVQRHVKDSTTIALIYADLGIDLGDNFKPSQLKKVETKQLKE